jgi:single-strand DNA-binding protein
MLNVIALCGRMVRDAEVKKVGNDSCANFTVAVERDYRKNGEKITDFFECTAWRQTADFVGRYCGKGREVTVRGSMESRKWTDKEGNKRTSWYVNCDSVNGVGSKQDAPEAGTFQGGYAAPAGGYAPYTVPQSGGDCQAGGYSQKGFGGYGVPVRPEDDYAMLTDDDGQLPF